MKIIIVGAGNVGLASAKAALPGNDVTIIEKDPNIAETAKNTLPVSILRSDASNPNVLRAALDRIKPKVILSTVRDDGLNIFICKNAKEHMPEIRTMSCIRNPDFLDANGYEGVDVLISPDTLTSDKMIQIARLENAVNYERLNIGEYCLITFRVSRGHEIVGRTVMNMTLPDNCAIVSIRRGDYTITEVSTAEIHVGDRILVLGTWSAADKFNSLIGIRKEAREFVILGAGHQGMTIAKSITESGSNFVKVLDDDLERCREASKGLKDAIIVKGNIVDPQFLRSESIDRADALISVTDIDERNLLACMTAMRFGIKKIISRYSIEEYEDIFKYAGIESVVGYHKIISNEITKNLRSTQNFSLYVLEGEGDSLISFTLDQYSPMVGKLYGDLVIPSGMNICAYVRNGSLEFPDLLTRFEEGDSVIIFTHYIESMELAKLLGKNAPEF